MHPEHDEFETVKSSRNGLGKGIFVGLILGLVAGGGAVWALRPKAAAAQTTQAGPKAYQCPMHPQILQDHAGACPICGMDLVVMEGSASLQSPGPEGLVSVQISAQRQQLIGLRTVKAERQSLGGELRLPGRVAVDERRVHKVAVRVEGYVERLQADFLGRAVRKGEALFELNSPEFTSAQREFRAALKAAKGTDKGEQAASYAVLVDSARQRLRYLGASEAQLARLEKEDTLQNLVILSPTDGVITAKTLSAGSKLAAQDQPLEITDLGLVWVWVDLYEGDAAAVKVGSGVTFTVPALAGRSFQGRVSFLDPAMDPKTRTLRARVELPNPGLQLRPEMLGEVVVKLAAQPRLWVPMDAVLDSGSMKVAFVDVGNGYFEPRELKTGRSAQGKVEVLDGLSEAEPVVTGANFMVDSESRLKAALSQMMKKAEGGHAH